jgi:hypothetical protein
LVSTLTIVLTALFTPAKAVSYYAREFGEVGDGRTNDQDAIQSAIDNASTNGGMLSCMDPGPISRVI